MLDCYENNFLSFQQIRKRHFVQNAKSTVYNRLSKLIQAKYLKSQKVNLLAFKSKKDEVGVLYQVTGRALSILQIYFPEKDVAKRIVPINQSTILHDLLLTDVLGKLKEKGGYKTVLNSKILKLKPDKSMRIPDALAFRNYDNKQTAIELELTAKSERRYREIVLKYQMDRNYSEVLYVVANKNIEHKITTQIVGKIIPGLTNMDTGKFRFLYLEKLLEANEHKQYQNINRENNLCHLS